MPQVVQGPDGGTVTFPDGTDDATISKIMAQAYPNQTAPSQGGQTPPGPGSGTGGPPPQSASATPDFGLSLAKSSDQVFDNAAILASKIPVIGPAMNNAAGPEHTAQAVADAHARFFADQEAKGHSSDQPVGNFAGSVLADLPLAAITRNPIALGAMSGGLGTKDPNDLGGTAIDTAAGGVAGKLGDAATKFIGGAINPLVKPAVDRMMKMGIPLTPGQIAGGALRLAENGAKYIPIVGDMIGNAQDKALTGFNNAAYNTALGFIGQKLPEGITGHEAAAFTQKAISDSYNRLLPTLRVMGDSQFKTDMTDLNNSVNQGGLPPEKIKQFTSLMQGVGARFSRAGGMTGRTMGDVDTLLGQEFADYNGSPHPDDQKMARAIKQAQSNLRNLVYRSNPQAAKALDASRAAFAHFAPLETAAGKGSTDELGRFQPGQLKAAIAENDSGVRNRATAQGRAAQEGLANDAIGQMGRTITSPKSLNPLLRGGAGAALFFGHVLHPQSALATLPYTETGGKLARWALTGRQGPISRAVGKAVRSTSPAAAIAAGAAAPKRSAVTVESVTPATPEELAQPPQ